MTIYNPFDALNSLSASAKDEFQFMLKERWTLFTPTVLIVEDQLFSQKILTNMLRHNNTCLVAPDLQSGMQLYLEHAPCITMLDIELPDGFGHTMAAAIREIDEHGYIVMVTAQNSLEAVQEAKKNNVNGFITKPYNKRKIMDVVDTYKKHQQHMRCYG